MSIEDMRHCYVEGCPSCVIESHHIFYGNPGRKLSERLGYKEDLCIYHHKDNRVGVHGLNKALDLELKQKYQRKFEESGTREEFREMFGKSYL